MVESVQELRKICQNLDRCREMPWWFKLYRSISIRVTRLILMTGIKVHPNWLTGLHMLFGVVGISLLLFRIEWVTVLAFILLFLTMLFDMVDGEYARYYNKTSLSGSYLDEVGHAIIDPFLFISLSIVVYLETNFFIAIILGFLASFFIRFIKVNSQMKYYFILKSILEAPEKFSKRKNSSYLLDKDPDVSKKEISPLRKGKMDFLLVWVNSLKHYLITVCIFLIFFLLDYSKSFNFIPVLPYKLILLYFYTVFLGLVSLGQVILEFRRIENTVMNMYDKMKVKLFGN